MVGSGKAVHNNKLGAICQIMIGEPFSVETRSAGKIHGVRWGNPNAPAVLGLHGWLDNVATFAPLSPLLADLQIFAIDLPGHGLSEHRPSGVRYHLLDYVPAALESADALKLGEFILMGHSLGGAISGLLTAAMPERIRALVLVEALGPLSEPEDKAAIRLSDSLHAYQSAYARTPAIYPELKALIKMRAEVGKMTEKSAQLLIERNTYRTRGGYQWRSDSRLRLPSPSYFSEAQVLEYLKAINVPTVIILGEDGLLLQRDTLAARLAALPEADVHRFRGGHHLHMDNPKPVAEAVSKFISTIA